MIASIVFAFALVLSSGVQAKDCLEELGKVNGKGLMGAFKPQCNADGTYKSMQYHGKNMEVFYLHESYYYCVIPKTGEEVFETRVRFVKPKSCDLTKCLLERHYAKKSGLLGAPAPTCDATGKYEKIQCREGVCWCANPATGAMLPDQDLTGDYPKC